LVSRAWSQWIVGSPVHIWEQKIKRDKADIKEWTEILAKNPCVEVEHWKRQLE